MRYYRQSYIIGVYNLLIRTLSFFNSVVGLAFFTLRETNIEPNFIELLKLKNVAEHNGYQNKVTSQATMSHVHFVTGILLISA